MLLCIRLAEAQASLGSFLEPPIPVGVQCHMRDPCREVSCICGGSWEPDRNCKNQAKEDLHRASQLWGQVAASLVSANSTGFECSTLNRRLRYRKPCNVQLIRAGGRIWAKANKVYRIYLHRGNPFKHGLGHQPQRFAEFLLPGGEVVIGDPNPRVGIIHHPGHAKGLEGCGFGFEANVPSCGRRSAQGIPSFAWPGRLAGQFPFGGIPQSASRTLDVCRNGTRGG